MVIFGSGAESRPAWTRMVAVVYGSDLGDGAAEGGEGARVPERSAPRIDRRDVLVKIDNKPHPHIRPHSPARASNGAAPE